MNSTIELIEKRVSTNFFDPAHTLTDAEIAHLARLATQAPTAYHLQNWRFIAVRSPKEKAKLRRIANNQPKITDAAVTFIIVGVLPDHTVIPERFGPLIESGLATPALIDMLQEAARSQYADPVGARDEAVRTATLGAATLMTAAQAQGLATCPMSGFDPQGIAREFGLKPDEIPAIMVAVGREAHGNWPQKPRRPLADILCLM